MQITRLGMTALWAAAISAAPLAGALAMGAGGGGGGQMPSISAPSYDPVAEYQHGAAAYKAGKFKEASRDFEHVTDAQPRVADAWFMLGMAKSQAGDDHGAARAFERAVKLDPAPVGPHREYAVSLARLKQTDKAGEQLAWLKSQAGACGDTCPQAADLKAAVAAVEQAMAGASPSASLRTPTSLLFASSEAGDAAYVRAVSLINEHRFEEALTALDKAQSAFGPHPDILTYKGYTWRKLGHLDRAESYYQAALAVDPNHRGATEYYGELKVIRGDMAGAKAMLARLDAQCAFGCAEAEDLRRWIDHGGDPAS
ncbi:MAG TPA: tetratricopeptide repeat protein [Caulobacteraceae bacterium]